MGCLRTILGVGVDMRTPLSLCACVRVCGVLVCVIIHLRYFLSVCVRNNLAYVCDNLLEIVYTHLSGTRILNGHPEVYPTAASPVII